MNKPFEKGPGASMNADEDEVGKPIWKIPEGEGGERQRDEDEQDEEIDFDIPPLPPRSNEVGIHAPAFDPRLQREWEERRRRELEEEEERKKKENPRGYWEMQ